VQPRSRLAQAAVGARARDWSGPGAEELGWREGPNRPLCAGPSPAAMP
jgi:hypothetical protein